MTTAGPRESNTTRERGRLAVVVLRGGGLLLLAMLVAFCSAKRAPGSPEYALVQAIASRDVAGARAALAAGANLTDPVQIDELGIDFPEPNIVWLLVEHMAKRSGLRSDGFNTDPELLEIARAVFERGGDPNMSMTAGASSRGRRRYLIEEAILANNPELIDIMVRAGLDVKGSTGRDPRAAVGDALLIACSGQYDTVALALIRAGVDVNYRNRGGATPLSQAVHYRRLELIDTLERAGALEWGVTAQ
jgi:hypothetical protein